VVKAGTLDSLEGLRPQTEIYTDHAVKWLVPVASALCTESMTVEMRRGRESSQSGGDERTQMRKAMAMIAVRFERRERDAAILDVAFVEFATNESPGWAAIPPSSVPP
jgi:hypothetical protein